MGRIYGVIFIDYENCIVLNGLWLGKDFFVNVFNNLFFGFCILMGNSKQEMQEYMLEFNFIGYFENIGKIIVGLFSLLFGGNDMLFDNS